MLLTFEIDANLHIEKVLVKVDQISVVSIAAIVHQDVDMSAGTQLDRCFDEVVADVLLRYASLDGDCVPSRGLDGGNQLVHSLRPSVCHVVQHYIGTSAAKLCCNASPYSPGLSSA